MIWQLDYMDRKKHLDFISRKHKRLSLKITKHANKLNLPKDDWVFNWVFETMFTEYDYAEIGILFCQLEEAKYYNKTYRAKDYATNVLSFELNQENVPNRLVGDLIICPEVVEKEAHEQGKLVMNHYAHLVVHGTLHLIGYDHILAEDAAIMESKEIKILHAMGIANPYLEE